MRSRAWYVCCLKPSISITLIHAHPSSRLPPTPLSPSPEKCWETALKTDFDLATKTVNSTPGFDIDTQGWPFFNGSNLESVLPYWQALGFTEGKDIVCANFDWRMPSIGLAKFYSRMQQLVEQMYNQNGNLAVDIIAISYGPQIALGFLHRMTQEWKNKYVRWFVAESPLWSGAALPPSVFAGGYAPAPNSPPYVVDFLRNIVTSTHGPMWIFPRPGNNNTSLWSDNEVIVRTPHKVYVASNMSLMLQDLGFELRAQSLPYLQAEPDLHDFAAPGVNTFITYGTQLPTPGSFVFDVDFTRNKSNIPPLPKVTNDPATGDTLVPYRSSRRALYTWPNIMKQQGLNFYSKEYPGQPHGGCCVANSKITIPCFNDVANLLLHGQVPANLDPIPSDTESQG